MNLNFEFLSIIFINNQNRIETRQYVARSNSYADTITFSLLVICAIMTSMIAYYSHQNFVYVEIIGTIILIIILYIRKKVRLRCYFIIS